MKKAAERPLARVYADAAGLVRKGWTKGRLMALPPSGSLRGVLFEPVRYCAFGALVVAAGETMYSIPTPAAARLVGPLCAYLKAQAGGEGFVTAWNDAPERTQGEVVAAFESVAKKLAEEELKGA